MKKKKPTIKEKLADLNDKLQEAKDEIDRIELDLQFEEEMGYDAETVWEMKEEVEYWKKEQESLEAQIEELEEKLR